MMTTRQLIQEIRRHQPAELALLLGAGASHSSGVPLGSEMIAEWYRDLFESRASQEERGRLTEETWPQAHEELFPWLGKDQEYSKLFELCYRTPVRRQKYIEEKIEQGRPGWGYLYLANLIVQARRFTTVFTTNFDDLVNEALSRFLHHNAVVCNADSEVDNINFLSDRAKIIKLHGDYLFLDIRNTEDELRELGKRMAEKFKELSRQIGLVVIGYAGRDQSVMSMLELLLEDPKSFPYSIYWGLAPGGTPSSRVDALANREARFQLFECPDFDSFMAGLHAELKLELPATILSPHSQLETQLEPLVRSVKPQDSPIRAHAELLRGQLGRPAEAELALSRRDYATAIQLADRHVRERGPGAAALTVWGEALIVQADEEGREDLCRDAVRKLEQAIQMDSKALPPRYALARLLWKRQMPAEAIRVCEELEQLTPNDHGLRRNLIQLYGQVQRLADAEREVEWLAAHESPSADLHSLRGSIRHAQGRSSEAIEEMKRAVSLMPDNANLRFSLGNMLISQHRVDEAEAEFREAARLAPDNALCLIAIAQVVWMRQRTGEAVDYLERASRSNPHSAEVRGRLGEVYMQMGRLPEAQHEIEEAVRLAPDDARIRANMGMILLYQNRIAEAEAVLRQARDLNSALPQPHFLLGLIFALQERGLEFNEAAQGLQRIHPMLAQQLQMQAQAIRMQAIQARGAGRPATWPQEQLWAQWQQMLQTGQQPAAPGGWRGPVQPGGPPPQQGFWTKLFGR